MAYRSPAADSTYSTAASEPETEDSNAVKTAARQSGHTNTPWAAGQDARLPRWRAIGTADDFRVDWPFRAMLGWLDDGYPTLSTGYRNRGFGHRLLRRISALTSPCAIPSRSGNNVRRVTSRSIEFSKKVPPRGDGAI